jgi:hypothetical protein
MVGKKDGIAAELKKRGIGFKGLTSFVCFHSILHHEDM